MVSLGRARGYFFEAEACHDNEVLVDDAVISCEEESPYFRPIPTIWAIVVQLVLLVSFEITLFVIPYTYCHDCDDVVPSIMSLLVYIHFVLWCMLLIFGRYLHFQENKYRRIGYLNFYLQTCSLRQVPVYVFSAGNSLLLLTVVLMEDYCKESFPLCPSHINLKPYHYVQILSTIEFMIGFPALLFYLVKTEKFNRSASAPDVEHDDRVLNFLYGQVPSTDIGFRDEDRLDDVLEKQADLIRYLKQHNASLGRKIVNLTTELKATKLRSVQVT